jgi:serine/threonine protein kinase
MPWLQGTLEDELASKIAYSEEIVINIALQIVEALNYAFERYHLVHLDLKPANVLIRSK